MLNCLVAALLAQASAAPAPGAPPAEESTLSGNVGLGAVVLTGNSESTTFAFNATLIRKTPDWIYGFKANGTYGRSTDPNTQVETTNALNGSLTARIARRFNPLVAVYLQGIVDTDHLKSIEWRPAGELGISFQLVDVKEGDFQTQALRVDFGFRGGHEYRFQYFPTPENLPDVTIAPPTAGFGYRYAFSKDTILADDLTAVLNLPDGGPRLLLNNVIKLSTRLVSSLTFAISYGIAEDTQPPPGKKNLDTTLTVAFEMTY